MAYNAVIRFGGNRHKGSDSEILFSNAFIIKIEMEVPDYDESTGQPVGGGITFHLLNGKGEAITRFITENARDVSDGGIRVSLLGGLG